MIPILARCSVCKRRLVGPVKVASDMLRDVLVACRSIGEEPAHLESHRSVFDHDLDLEIVWGGGASVALPERVEVSHG